MQSTQRAKLFLQKKGRALALVAMPLAMVSVPPPAKAGPINPLMFTYSSCSGGTTNATITASSCGASPLGTMMNGVNGVTMTGDTTGMTPSSGGTFAVKIDWGGTTNGTPFTGLPVGWNFTVIPSSAGAYSWSLTFTLGGIATIESGTGTGTTTFMGTGAANVGTGTSFDVLLQVTQNASMNATLELKAASGHIDINASSVPEPSTLLLASPLLGYLVLRRRRKKT